MTSQTISATDVNALINQGARLFDIRDSAEYQREHIAQATSLPLSQIENGVRIDDAKAGERIVFHCLSGMRTAKNAEKLAQAAAPAEVYILQGGINAWKQQGLPTIEDKSQPLPIMRQVQIAAGSLVLLGTLLGYFVTPAFLLLSGFVGAGLLFAGLSGCCGMALLLARMPWNK